MKVVLATAPSPPLFDPHMHVPLGVLYVASALRNAGHDVQVVDGDRLGIGVAGPPAFRPQENWIDRLPECDLLGLSATTPNFCHARALADAWPARIKVIGGPHASHAPEYAVGGFDFCVIGEGEEVIVRLASGETPSKVPGLAWRDASGCFRTTGPATPVKIASVAPPAFDLWGPLPTNTLRSHKQPEDAVCAPIITARGCPFACAFCASRRSKLRLRSIEDIEGELDLLLSRHAVRSIRIQDDSFTVDEQRTRRIAWALGDRDLIWRCHTRTNLTDSSLLGVMRANGCVEVGLGVESGSQRMLDLMQKGTTVEQNARAIKACQDAGLSVRAFIMAGFPGETRSTLEETTEFVLRTRPDMVTFAVFQPYPGSDVWQRPSAYGVQIPTDCFERWWQVGLEGTPEELVLDLPSISKHNLFEARLQMLSLFEHELGPRDRSRATHTCEAAENNAPRSEYSAGNQTVEGSLYP